MNNKRLVRRYGVGGFSTCIIFTLYTSYGMYFYTDVVGIEAVMASVIVMIGTFWDAITDPLIGAWSDNRVDKRGRRLPVMLRVAIPYGLAAWLLFTDFGFTGVFRIIYFALVTMAFYTCSTLLDVSYSSLAADLTDDYDLRSRLSTSRGIWLSIAMIVSAFFLAIASSATELLGSVKLGWSVTAGGFGLLNASMIILGCFLLRGYEKPALKKEKSERSKINMQTFRELWRNKPFMNILFMFMLGIIAQTISYGFNTYYCYNNLQFTSTQVTIVTFVLYLGGLISMPLIDLVMQKWGKKACWYISLSLAAASFIIFPLFVLRENSFALMCVHSLLISSAYNVFYLVPWAMIPDTVDVDDYQNGKRREGLLYGLANLLQKFSAGIAYLVCGLALSAINYDSSLAVQSAQTLSGLKYGLALGTAAPLILGVIVSIFNPLTKEKHRRYIAALERRNAGLPANDPELD